MGQVLFFLLSEEVFIISETEQRIPELVWKQNQGVIFRRAQLYNIIFKKTYIRYWSIYSTYESINQIDRTLFQTE
jgi:hypothetical protein